jgi:superfamily II DNA or RNA helicase
MTAKIAVPSVSVQYQRTGASTKANELGMRVMQERAYAHRGEQYLLIKSPPASGKSRALMYIALDKLTNQGVRQAIIVVPERSIGGSFADASLSKYGFWADWTVKPQWNLCNAPGNDEPGRVAKSKVKAVSEFLASADKVLVCTHATFRFAVEEFGTEAFDDRLIAIDEFHHVSASDNSVLGRQLNAFLTRDKVHMVAMTGSYFRGDAAPVLNPDDERKFTTVTYTYYEQLNGYEHLKALDIGYFFYQGPYVDAIMKVLDPDRKTIIHIPNVNSREALGDKIREANDIMHELGTWKGEDAETGFQLIERPDGRVLKVADLVDDGPKREKVIAALKKPEANKNRNYVDIIIALAMAREGFDWIWCEHALTIGYRNSLTEVIQIIGRATRDAPGKSRARFTNLIAEPDAAQEIVTDAVNDTLKAIAASLLMEQVLAPRFNFVPKTPQSGPQDGFDYGAGYDPKGNNIGFNKDTGQLLVEVKGLISPESREAARICKEDINEVITAFVQDKPAIERGLFDEDTLPEELTQVRMGKIVKDKYPTLSDLDQEAIRQHAIAALALTQKARQLVEAGEDETLKGNTAIIDGVRKFAMDVRELDIDLIDSINPFEAAYNVLAKTMSEGTLKQVAAAISAKRTSIPPDEAWDLAERATKFRRERRRLPSITSTDAWEKKMAEGILAFQRHKTAGAYDKKNS